MMMTNKKTVIFDMDGVIFDSENVYLDELIQFFKNYDIDISEKQCEEVIGIDNRLFESKIYSWWNNKTSKEEFTQLLNTYYKQIKRDYQKILNPHIIDLLDYLKNHRYKIALASSSSRKLIHYALENAKLTKYFDLIVSGDEFEESKPNPQIYLYTMEELHVTKHESLIIEDSYPGILAAKRAGVDVIALKNKSIHLDQSQANYIVHDLIEVIKLLKDSL